MEDSLLTNCPVFGGHLNGQNARIEHDKALGNVIIGLMKDDTELFKQFSDNPEFKRWLADTIFTTTYDRPTSTPP